ATADTSLVAVAPAKSAGTVDVTVVNAVGTSATSSADQYRFAVAPQIQRLTPNFRTSPGGTAAVIQGTSFAGATAGCFGSVPAPGFTVTSDTQITATSPAQPLGTVASVKVTTPGGTSNGVSFTYGGPQLFAGAAVAPAADVPPLTAAALQPLAREAIARW